MPRDNISLEKPAGIANSSFKSTKWDEITGGRKFSTSDIPTITLLINWYAVIERCCEDMDTGGELPQVAYMNSMDDIKAMPQLATMKQASAEIRALNKQLGINDSHEEVIVGKKKNSTLALIQGRRDRKARAANGA